MIFSAITLIKKSEGREVGVINCNSSAEFFIGVTTETTGGDRDVTLENNSKTHRKRQSND